MLDDERFRTNRKFRAEGVPVRTQHFGGVVGVRPKARGGLGGLVEAALPGWGFRICCESLSVLRLHSQSMECPSLVTNMDVLMVGGVGSFKQSEVDAMYEVLTSTKSATRKHY